MSGEVYLTEELGRLILEQRLGYRIVDERPEVRVGEHRYYLDALGLKESNGKVEVAYLEVKSWKRPVGAPVIRRLLRAIEGSDARLIVMAYRFSEEAYQLAKRHRKVILLDAETLGELLGKHITPPSVLKPENIQGILFSVKPERFRRLLKLRRRLVGFVSGSVRRYVRRGLIALFYVTSPIMRIEALGWVIGYIRDSPNAIWSNYKELIGWKRQEFYDFVGSRSRISLFLIENLRRVRRPMPLKVMQRICRTEGVGFARAGYYLDRHTLGRLLLKLGEGELIRRLKETQ